MISTQALRDQLDAYVDGAIRSEALEEWIASESWEMHRWAMPGLRRLVEAIQSAFISHSEGNLSAEALDEFLRGRCVQLHKADEATKPLEEALRSYERPATSARKPQPAKDTESPLPSETLTAAG